MSSGANSDEFAYVGLGANLDDPVSHVVAGFAALTSLPGTRLIARSSLYRTAPVGYLDQPDFINAAAQLKTALSSRELLQALLEIERDQGRVRKFPNAPRTLDLDILLYGDQCIDEPGLTLPHPRLHERAFALLPLNEIAPSLTIPGRGSVHELLRAVDVSGVQLLKKVAA